MKQTKTLKVQVRDKHAKRLNKMARNVNYVWNYINELSQRAIRGRWYFNVVVDAELEGPSGQDKIGIDLGLKDTATCSDGTKLEAGRFYRDLEPKRARKKKRVKAIQAKIANRRKDALLKFS